MVTRMFRYLVFIPVALFVQFIVSIVVYNLQHYFNIFNPFSTFLGYYLASYLGFQAGIGSGPKNKKVPVILITMYMFVVSAIIFQLVRESPLVEGRLGAGIIEAFGLCCGSWLGFLQMSKGSFEPRANYALSKSDKKFYKAGLALQWLGGLMGFILSLSGSNPLFLFIALSLFLLGCFLEVCSRGNYDFWLKVKNHPDLAYDWFRGNGSWLIIDDNSIKDYEKMLSMRDWVGPFHLAVPKLQGKTIRIYGRSKELLHSEKEFLTLIQSIEN